MTFPAATRRLLQSAFVLVALAWGCGPGGASGDGYSTENGEGDGDGDGDGSGDGDGDGDGGTHQLPDLPVPTPPECPDSSSDIPTGSFVPLGGFSSGWEHLVADGMECEVTDTQDLGAEMVAVVDCGEHGEFEWRADLGLDLGDEFWIGNQLVVDYEAMAFDLGLVTFYSWGASIEDKAVHVDWRTPYAASFADAEVPEFANFEWSWPTGVRPFDLGDACPLDGRDDCISVFAHVLESWKTLDEGSAAGDGETHQEPHYAWYVADAKLIHSECTDTFSGATISYSMVLP